MDILRFYCYLDRQVDRYYFVVKYYGPVDIEVKAENVKLTVTLTWCTDVVHGRAVIVYGVYEFKFTPLVLSKIL